VAEFDIAFAPDGDREGSVVRTGLHTVDRGLTTAQQRFHVALEHPGELLDLVPALLGFHPSDSLVVLGLHGPAATSVGVVLRSDLPPPSQARALAGCLLLPLLQHNIEAVVLIVVSGRTSTDDLPHRELLARCESVFADRDLSVVHQLWTPDTAAGRQWWCYDDYGCHGALPATDTCQGGRITYDRREDIVATITPDPDDVLARRTAAFDHLTDTTGPGTTEPDDPITTPTERTGPGRATPDRSSPPSGGGPVRAKLATVHAALAAAVATPPTLSDDEVIRLANALSDDRVRDMCLDFDRLPDMAAAERLWTALSRTTPAPQRCEPACLLAFSAYARGDGVLAGIALDQALKANPQHRLTNLVRTALTLGLEPDNIRIAGTRAATFARQALNNDLSSTAEPPQTNDSPAEAHELVTSDRCGDTAGRS